MPTDVKVPAAGESISEVFIGTWLKAKGDSVAQDEPLVEVETDKATLEVPSPVAGVVTELLKAVGDSAAIGEVIARVDQSAVAADSAGSSQAAAAAGTASVAVEAATTEQERPAASTADQTVSASAVAASAAPTAAAPAQEPAPEPAKQEPRSEAPTAPTSVLPAAQRLLDEHGVNANEVAASGPGGRLLKEDVQAYLAQRERAAASDIVSAPVAAAAPAVPGLPSSYSARSRRCR